MAIHRRQVQQHGEPRRALHQRADRRTVEPEDEVPLPVPRHRAVLRLGRTLADEDLGSDERLATSTASRAWHAQGPTRAQALGQLASQRTTALDVERLVDGLMADAHRPVAREVEPQAPGDLLRAPRPGPSPVLPPP